MTKREKEMFEGVKPRCCDRCSGRGWTQAAGEDWPTKCRDCDGEPYFYMSGTKRIPAERP